MKPIKSQCWVGGRRKSSVPLTERAGAPCAVDEELEDAPSILALEDGTMKA